MKNLSSTNLKYVLKDWTEIDVAAFRAGVALGIIPQLESEDVLYDFSGKKWIFWTQNPLGSLLFELLESLVAINVLEKSEIDDHLYRWNSNFDWNEL